MEIIEQTRTEVLRAVVSEYVNTAEPVGRTLVRAMILVLHGYYYKQMADLEKWAILSSCMCQGEFHLTVATDFTWTIYGTNQLVLAGLLNQLAGITTREAIQCWHLRPDYYLNLQLCGFSYQSPYSHEPADMVKLVHLDHRLALALLFSNGQVEVG